MPETSSRVEAQDILVLPTRETGSVRMSKTTRIGPLTKLERILSQIGRKEESLCVAPYIVLMCDLADYDL